MELNIEWFASVPGIIGATIFIVSMLKRGLGGVSGLNQVPTWIYAVLVSGLLTTLAHQVLHTLPGDNLFALINEVVIKAAAASGIYEWVSNSLTTTLEQSKTAITDRPDQEQPPVAP